MPGKSLEKNIFDHIWACYRKQLLHKNNFAPSCLTGKHWRMRFSCLYVKHAGKNSHNPSSLCILYTRKGEHVSVLVFKFVLNHERLQSLALHAILKASQTSSCVCSWLSDMRWSTWVSLLKGKDQMVRQAVTLCCKRIWQEEAFSFLSDFC